MEGQGTYVWDSGEVYVGEYRNNVRHGKGTMTYSDGSIFDGWWVEDNKVVAAATSEEDSPLEALEKGEQERKVRVE